MVRSNQGFEMVEQGIPGVRETDQGERYSVCCTGVRTISATASAMSLFMPSMRTPLGLVNDALHVSTVAANLALGCQCR